MNYGISTVPHRDVVLKIRNLIQTAKDTAFFGMKSRNKDIETLDTTYEAHIRAKTAFSTSNSDLTMINLIGTWARLNRIMMEMEEKYGLGK